MRVAILLLMTSTASAETKDAAAWCATNSSDALPARGDVIWRGRIDRDNSRDVIVNLGECGTRECIHAAYVRCPDGTYSRVFAGYASRLRFIRRAGWARLDVEHVGDPDRRGERPRRWFRVRFTDEGYQED